MSFEAKSFQKDSFHTEKKYISIQSKFIINMYKANLCDVDQSSSSSNEGFLYVNLTIYLP